MTKLFRVVLGITLLAFTAPSQAQTSQQKAGAQGPDLSDGPKKTKLGRLPKKSEINHLESRLKTLLNKIDPKVSGRYAVPNRLVRAREGLARVDKLNDGWVLQEKKAPAWWRAIPHDNFHGYDDPHDYWPTLDYSSETKGLMNKWIPKYKKYLKKKYGTSDSLSPEQLQQQVWHWLIPREKAERKARIKWLEKEYAHNLKSIREIRDRLVKIKAAADDKRMRKEDIKKNKDKKKETNKERKLALGENPKPKGEDNRIVEADEDGLLTGKALKLTDLEGCGAVFLKFDAAENFGWISTSCSGLTGGRVATQADYLTYCNSFDRPRIECRPPGPGTEKRIEKSGIQGMPFSAFCLGLHFNILANRGDVFNSTVKAGKLVSVFKYDNNSRKLECYYVSFAQSKVLRDQFKNPGKVVDGSDVKTAGKPKDTASSTETKTVTTTTSVKNPDGTRTVTRTGRDGKVQSEETVGRSPASAISTNRKTGVTTKSVRNPDGTRTVTKTDKNGIVLSRETVGNDPDSASSTDLKTNVTIKSVTNPDGSRTVTITDKDGIVLSKEKVR